jgi:hypothetical protein
MALFEQRFTEEEVTAARKKIAGGASLRSAAGEIGCAPSTLSVRIKKAEAAEAAARARAGIGDDGQRVAQGARVDPGSLTFARREGAAAGDTGPVDVLRGALGATKANGQPDWPTRVSAARALAALRPDEANPKTEHTQEPSIVVYDLPPGTDPVLHRARSGGAEVPVSDAEAPSKKVQTPDSHVFYYCRQGGEFNVIGSWFPALHDRRPDAVVKAAMHMTEDAETAELWRAELAAGRMPQDSDAGTG